MTNVGAAAPGELPAVVLDAQTQNGDEPVGEITYPRAKLPF